MPTPIRLALLATATVALCFVTGCTSSNTTSSAPTPDSITLSLTPTAITVTPNAAASSIAATITRSTTSTGAITLAISGLPANASAAITQPGSGSAGAIAFSSISSTTPGIYPLTVTATDGTATSTAALTATFIATDVLSLSAASPTLTALQDGTPAPLALTIGRTFGNTGAVTVSATSLPTGLTATFTQPGTGTAGSVTFATSATPATAGTYTVILSATDGVATASTSVSVTISPVLTALNAVDTTIGVSGHLQQFMSTGFQPSTYDNSYFINFPSTTDLAALDSKHIRLQPVVGAIPWLANSSPQAASDWSFTGLDQTVQPVLKVGDDSPIFQIAKAPSFMDDASGHFIYNSTNLQLLTTYAQNLVRYYNAGGFTYAGQHFQSASSTHITWWAIFNEPNLNNVTPAQYVSMYNTLVPAMLAIDPTLKFVGLELSDFTGQPQTFLPTLVQPAASGGINAQMNAIATHFYGTCMQTTTDTALFSGIAQFATDVKYFYTELALRSDLATVPVWVTENNVNSDYPLTNGYSSCTPTVLYVLDTRGTSAFFTAYRPLIFSKLGKAGSQSLYHFLYEGSQAYGEVNSGSNAKTLAYWTDFWLERTFPWDGVSTGASLYKTTTTEPTPSVDIMATRNADNSVSLMITNYAVAAATDDNGAGTARTVTVNLAALGAFRTGTEVDLNAATTLTTGPVVKNITPTTTLTLSFTGYGASLFTLEP